MLGNSETAILAKTKDYLLFFFSLVIEDFKTIYLFVCLFLLAHCSLEQKTTFSSLLCN